MKALDVGDVTKKLVAHIVAQRFILSVILTGLGGLRRAGTGVGHDDVEGEVSLRESKRQEVEYG